MTMAEAVLLEPQPRIAADNSANTASNNNNNNECGGGGSNASGVAGKISPLQNNNHLFYANHINNNVKSTTAGGKQRKRKRLSQVLDKLTGHVVQVPSSTTINNNVQHLNNNLKEEDDTRNDRLIKASKPLASLEMFRYETTERYQPPNSEDEDVFSPASSSNKSPHSSTDSPRISFSPLRLKEDEASSSPPLPPKPCPCYQCVTGLGHHQPTPLHPYDRFFPASPISPGSPVTGLPLPPPPYSFERYLHTKYLPDLFRRRSHSDSDLWFEASKPERMPRALGPVWPHPLSISTNNYVIRETAHLSPQEAPLDLSMKTLIRNSSASSDNLVVAAVPPPVTSFQMAPTSRGSGAVSVPVVKGDVASPTTKESVASRYNLEVSPVVEEMPPGSDVAYVCPVCGQMFSLHDRLAKHMASRHKSRQSGANSGDPAAKAYLCEVCKRSFARSDMLTRHMRLHTGVKPYTCLTCGQVFSRSDHLSTHQRTHTGEKPYRCPQCPYAACRRDMITRHLRTHARYEPDNAQAQMTVKTEQV